MQRNAPIVARDCVCPSLRLHMHMLCFLIWFQVTFKSELKGGVGGGGGGGVNSSHIALTAD